MADQIEIPKQVEKTIVVMQRTTFDMVLRLWQDENKTIPDPLAGRTFKFEVRDKSGVAILQMSTAAGQGITIQNINELAFLNQLAIVNGIYRYTLTETNGTTVRPVMQGDFVVQKNQVA
jgi:hypothetical protein